ncbi:fungal-specific transcription factor domain-containing protein [Aspergillus multicolor]|uniref:transcription factor domain-containing protein n=1 Tax=Aspergillus multicolor TaxID=41759 RepID=UPI003CCD8646
MATEESTKHSSRQQPGSACDDCRKRKLRCDRLQPQCGNCAEAGIPCSIRTTRPPRGPKKGHLRMLRQQIAVLESRLEEQEKCLVKARAGADANLSNLQISSNNNSNSTSSSEGELETAQDQKYALFTSPVDITTSEMLLAPLDVNATLASSLEHLDNIPSNIQLTDIVQGDLDQLYFDRAHPFAPMMHRWRYTSWARLPDKGLARSCLQNAMWTLAASLSSQFQYLRDVLQRDTRRMLAQLENGDSSQTFEIEHVQAWILLATHDFICGHHQRGLLSAGRAFRFIQLMRLFEIDSPNSSLSHSDFIEVETRRRTFWAAYTMDRFISVKNGLPLTLNEQENCSRLPCPEAQFQSGEPVIMSFLSEVIGQSSYAFASPFTECVIVATIWGRSLSHKHRTAVEQIYGNVTPEFWNRHRWLDAILRTRIKLLSLQYSSLSEAMDPMLIFVILIANTNVLFLSNIVESLPLAPDTELLNEYREHSRAAAEEILTMTETLVALNRFQAHPFMPIPLALCAEFSFSYPALKDSFQARVLDVLQRLTDVNSLAQVYLPPGTTAIEI